MLPQIPRQGNCNGLLSVGIPKRSDGMSGREQATSADFCRDSEQRPEIQPRLEIQLCPEIPPATLDSKERGKACDNSRSRQESPTGPDDRDDTDHPGLFMVRYKHDAQASEFIRAHSLARPACRKQPVVKVIQTMKNPGYRAGVVGDADAVAGAGSALRRRLATATRPITGTIGARIRAFVQ